MKYIPIVKSVGAIVAGFLAVAGLSIFTDFLLESAGMFPPATQPEEYTRGMLIFALLYRSIYAVIGGFVTAWLAPVNKMRHVMVLGILGTIGGIIGIYIGWDLAEKWYPIALAVTAYPLVWWGGKIFMKRSSLN